MSTLAVLGERPGLRGLELEVLGASEGPEGVVFEVRFVNTSATSYAVAGELGAGAFVLVDTSGEEVAAVEYSPGLSRLDGGEGLSPGAVRTGWVRFPSPRASPALLRLEGFPDLRFEGVTWAHLLTRGVSSLAETSSAPKVGTTPDEEREELPTEQQALDNLFATHARALVEFDLETYLDTFVPERREEERRLFLRIRPLALVAADLARRPGIGALRGAGGTLRLSVDLSYRLEGIPEDNPFVHGLEAVVEGGPEGPLIVSLEAPLEDLPPWRAEELALHRTNHFHILTHPSLQSELVDLSADAEFAWATLARHGLPLESGYVLNFVAGEERFRRLAGHPAALGVAVGRYTPTLGGYRVDSRAIFVNGPVFARRRGALAELRRVTVTHELVHLVLAEDSRPYTPAWLKEGVAVYFSERPDDDTLRQLVRGGLDRFQLDAMTRASALGEHDSRGAIAAAEYMFSGQVVAWLVERGGRERLLSFYGSFAETPLWDAAPRPLASVLRIFDTTPGGGRATEMAEGALESYYGLSVAALEAEVKGWLELRFGG